MSVQSKYLLPLVKLAKHFDNFEDFQYHYCCKNFHGLYWHLTDNPNFVIDPKKSPRDMSSLAISQNGIPGLMVTTDIDNWDATFRGTRKYAALIDLSELIPNVDYKTTTRGFGHEMYVFKPEKAKVVKVLPIQKAKRLSNLLYKKKYPDSAEKLKKIYNLAHKTQIDEVEEKNPRLGKCYELTGKYVSGHPNEILVHGKLINPTTKGNAEIDHTGLKMVMKFLTLLWI